jgi:hypothetical protein
MNTLILVPSSTHGNQMVALQELDAALPQMGLFQQPALAGPWTEMGA